MTFDAQQILELSFSLLGHLPLSLFIALQVVRTQIEAQVKYSSKVISLLSVYLLVFALFILISLLQLLANKYHLFMFT